MSKSKNDLVILTEKEIMAAAPQVYTKYPMTRKVSKKYSFIPTYKIVEDMKKLGWEVCQAVTMKTNDKDQQKYGKHMVKFFNPNIMIAGDGEQAEAYPQILIINNHRGWGRFKFEIGIFRLVCGNGLVIKEKDFGTFVMRHLGYSFEDLRVLVNKAVETLPGVVEKINKMEKTLMSPVQMKSFAIKALRLRAGEEASPSDNEINEVLTAVREADKGNSFWKVFNRVQEKVIKGGYSMVNTDKKERKVRAITNMLKDVELNQQLWELADEVMGVVA